MAPLYLLPGVKFDISQYQSQNAGSQEFLGGGIKTPCQTARPQSKELYGVLLRFHFLAGKPLTLSCQKKVRMTFAQPPMATGC